MTYLVEPETGMYELYFVDGALATLEVFEFLRDRGYDSLNIGLYCVKVDRVLAYAVVFITV